MQGTMISREATDAEITLSCPCRRLRGNMIVPTFFMLGMSPKSYHFVVTMLVA